MAEYESESEKEQQARMKATLAYMLGMSACLMIGILLLRIGLWTFFPTVIETPLPPFVYEVWEFLHPLGRKAKEIVDMIAVK